jgi:hypothetical protein
MIALGELQAGERRSPDSSRPFPMMLPRLTLVVAFRETGWRRPLVDPVAIEVWSALDGRLVATLPASHILELIRWHLAAVSLQGELARHLTPPPPPPPRLRAAQIRRLRGRSEA